MKKQCKRKIWILVNPLTHVLEGIRPTSGEKLAKLRTLELSALEAFRTGKANIYDWQHLTDMANIAEYMANKGIGPEVNEYAEKAQLELLDVARRYKKTKKLGITGSGLQALRDLHEYHDLQRTSISLSEYDKCLKNCRNRINSKAPEVVDVLEAA